MNQFSVPVCQVAQLRLSSALAKTHGEVEEGGNSLSHFLLLLPIAEALHAQCSHYSNTDVQRMQSWLFLSYY